MPKKAENGRINSGYYLRQSLTTNRNYLSMSIEDSSLWRAQTPAVEKINEQVLLRTALPMHQAGAMLSYSKACFGVPKHGTRFLMVH